MFFFEIKVIFSNVKDISVTVINTYDIIEKMMS